MTEATSTADTGRFLTLRGDVRQLIRITEVQMQTTIIQMLQGLIPLLGPEIVAGMQSVIGETPAKFLNDNFALYEEISMNRDHAEGLQGSAGARNAHLN